MGIGLINKMNVLYCVSELTDWIDVAKYFNDNKNWKPICWITTKRNQNYCKKIFPDLKQLDFFDINRGIIENIEINNSIIIDYKIISQYSKYEKIALKMMDRMDPLSYSFNYTQRIHLYHKLLQFLLNYLNNTKTDLIIFNESPHSIFTYLAYCIAKENNIKILRLSPTHINANTFLTSSLESNEQYIQDIYKSDLEISKEVVEYIDTINGKYDSATPYYMGSIIQSSKQSNTTKIIKSILKATEYFFRRKPRLTYHKNKPLSSIREHFTNKEFSKTIIASTLYKIKLQKKYNQYVNKTKALFNMEDNFIYFPLQYQPEKSTSPEGDIFADQYLAINMLSKLSKGRFKIYIKEHISQFAPKLHGEQGRNIDFYQELSYLDHIVFVDTSINSFSLIDKAIAVSTITGTAGMESIIRGKPSIIFGYPWYKDAHGVFQISNHDQLDVALDSILNNYTIDLDKVKKFLNMIFYISNKIYLNNSNKNSIQDPKHSNSKEIINLIEKYENKIS